MSRFRRRPQPLLGIALGVTGAVLLTLVAVMIYVLKGPGVFEQIGMSLGATIGLYFAGGLIGGALLGFLFPLTVSRLGATFVGIVVVSPLYLGAAILLGDPDLLAGIIASVAVGGLVGYGLWAPPSEEQLPP